LQLRWFGVFDGLMFWWIEVWWFEVWWFEVWWFEVSVV
jgi:hypothetical protein